MCDDKDLEAMVEYELRKGGLSRRELGALTLGAGFAFALPRAANATETTESDVEIKTPDGTADAYFVHPTSGKHPAVLVWPDIFGLRPAFRQMGKRLAESGYAVLVVNPFYREDAGLSSSFAREGVQGSQCRGPHGRDTVART